MMRVNVAALWVVMLFAGTSLAQHADHPPHGGDGVHGADHGGHGADHGGHGADHGGHDAHINWAHGFIGERDGVSPSVLWRPMGTPPPVLANIFNAGLLFFILYRFGKAPLAAGLKKRKARIVAGMEEAGQMKSEAEESLAEYERKLKHVDDEIERVRREMRESAEAERARILSDAKERRERMEREARMMVEQELKAARERLLRETGVSAVRSAREILQKQIGSQDHERLAAEYVELLSTGGAPSRGGRA
jgi:F-type H+-transporting ATPase subunit b